MSRPQRFAYVLKLWSYIGLRVVEDDVTSWDRTRRRRFYAYILIMAVAQCFFLKELTKSETFEEGMHVVGTLINMSHTWAVVFSVIFFGSVYKEVTLALANDFWGGYLDEETHGELLRRSVGLEERLAKIVLGVCIAASIAQEVLPLFFVQLADTGNQTVVIYHVSIDLFTPFDRSNVAEFVVDRILMIVLVFNLMFIAVASNSYYNSLLVNCASQFEMLNASLEALVDRAQEDYFIGGARDARSRVLAGDVEDLDAVQSFGVVQEAPGNPIHEDKEITSSIVKSIVIRNSEGNETSRASLIRKEEKLSKLVEIHQKLISAVDKLNYVMSPVVFFLYVSVAINLCVLTYEAVISVEEESSDIVMVLSQLLFVIMRLGVYCYLGDAIIEQAEDTYKKIYSTDWYAFTPSSKATVTIMMARAQRRMPIHSIMVGELSLEAYADILNKTYSYFTILKNMRDS